MKKILTEVIHPNASDLPGHLLLVVLGVRSAFDHQTTKAKSRHVGIQEKDPQCMNIKVLQSSCLWVR